MQESGTQAAAFVAADALTRWLGSVFRQCRVIDEDAIATASVLVRTNLRGIDTHGVARAAGYVEKLRSGEVNPRPSPSSEWRNGALFYDADGGLGQSAATAAMQAAISRARNDAVVPCFLRRSGHLAALGMFVLAAAEAGMIALMCQETPPLMAPLGSKRPAIGNNPIAFALPLQDRPPLVFDMATSVVSRGSVLQAARDGVPIPDSWAIGPDGKRTTDPTTALRGAMLPVGDHKGIGLAMLVQCLAGSLTASDTATSAAAFGSSSSAGNVSAFVLVINPDLLVERAAFTAHSEAWLSTYLDASGEGRYPGERAAACERQRTDHGVPLSQNVLQELADLGASTGCPWDLVTREVV